MTTTTEIKEHSIIFSGPMVRAILDGRKTQTRRVMKVQPSMEGMERATVVDTTCDKRLIGKTHWVKMADNGYETTHEDGVYFKCPYGVPGDRLWVRETWKTCNEGGYVPGVVYSDGKQKYPEFEELDKMPKDWQNFKRNRPSIHMPRWASRIYLLVKNIRVERVKDITSQDAQAEGVKNTHDSPLTCGLALDYRPVFQQLWDSINAKRGFGWEVNPWVWVVEFEKVQA